MAFAGDFAGSLPGGGCVRLRVLRRRPASPADRAAGPGSGPHSSESLVISALLSSGSFTPERYHLSISDLSCYRDLWSMCMDYQRTTGEALSLSPP